MPTFIALHKYNPKDELTIMKELVAGFTAIAEGKGVKGVELCATYEAPPGTQRVFCVWKAPSLADLEKSFDQFAPTLKKYTEFVPVCQSYPPTMEYVIALWKLGIQAASK